MTDSFFPLGACLRACVCACLHACRANFPLCIVPNTGGQLGNSTAACPSVMGISGFQSGSLSPSDLVQCDGTTASGGGGGGGGGSGGNGTTPAPDWSFVLGGTTYVWVPQWTTFADAEAQCASRGGHLASIHSASQVRTRRQRLCMRARTRARTHARAHARVHCT